MANPTKTYEEQIDYLDKLEPFIANLQTGSNGEYRGICPFHDDEHPSFSFNRHSRLSKCHADSSGEHGNVLTGLRRPVEVKGSNVTWLIEHILPAKTLTMLSGKDKLGKTLLAWEMARAVVTGHKLFGKLPVEQPGLVVFLALDDPMFLTGERLDRLGLRNAESLRLATPQEMAIENLENIDRLGEVLFSNIRDELKRQDLKPVLIILDALYLLLPSGEKAMNDAALMVPLVRNLNRLARDVQAAVLVVTHDRKSGGDVAGSFVIRAGAKQILRLTTKAKGKGNRTLKVEGKFSTPDSLVLDFKGPGAWRLIKGLKGMKQNLQRKSAFDAVAAYLEAGGSGTVKQVATAVARNEGAVRKALTKLDSRGKADRKRVPPKGGTGRPRGVWYGTSAPAKSKLDRGAKVGAEKLNQQMQQ